MKNNAFPRRALALFLTLALCLGLIQGSNDITADMLAPLETELEAMKIDPSWGCSCSLC